MLWQHLRGLGGVLRRPAHWRGTSAVSASWPAPAVLLLPQRHPSFECAYLAAVATSSAPREGSAERAPLERLHVRRSSRVPQGGASMQRRSRDGARARMFKCARKLSSALMYEASMPVVRATLVDASVTPSFTDLGRGMDRKPAMWTKVSGSSVTIFAHIVLAYGASESPSFREAMVARSLFLKAHGAALRAIAEHSSTD